MKTGQTLGGFAVIISICFIYKNLDKKCHFMKYLRVGQVLFYEIFGWSMQPCIIYVCVCVCVKKKRGWCKLHLFIFFSQFNKPTQMANPIRLELGSGWDCTQCNYPHSRKIKIKINYSYFLTFLPFFNSTVEIKVVSFNIKSQLFRTIVSCAIPQSASLTTSMLFNPIKSSNLPSLSFAKSKCCCGSFIWI